MRERRRGERVIVRMGKEKRFRNVRGGEIGRQREGMGGEGVYQKGKTEGEKGLVRRQE